MNLNQLQLKVLSPLLMCLAAMMFSSCSATSVQRVPMPSADAEAPQGNMCRIYMARSTQVLGRKFPIDIIDNQTPIGSIGRGGYLCWDRTAGQNLIQLLYQGAKLADGEVEGVLGFDGEPGETYYYLVELRPEDRKPTARRLDAAEGQALISSLTPANINM